MNQQKRHFFNGPKSMYSEDPTEDPSVYFSNVPKSTASQDPTYEPSNHHSVIPSIVICLDTSVFSSSIPPSATPSIIQS